MAIRGMVGKHNLEMAQFFGVEFLTYECSNKVVEPRLLKQLTSLPSKNMENMTI